MIGTRWQHAVASDWGSQPHPDHVYVASQEESTMLEKAVPKSYAFEESFPLKRCWPKKLIPREALLPIVQSSRAHFFETRNWIRF